MAIQATRRGHGDVVLSDGTRFSELIDRDRHEVSLRVLHDPEIYRLELTRLFARSWIMVGHENEIPDPGDFMLRFIGEDAVVVIRQADGSIEIFLNVCAHRGMQVCRTERGNTGVFTCPYHAWKLDTHGEFLAAPLQTQMYGDTLDRDQLGLLHARVETMGGVIFGNFDPDAPTLREFFGDLTFYLECLLERTDNGLEVLGAPQRALIKCNWKCPAEQGPTDGYHVISLHRSFMDLGFFGGDPESLMQLLLSLDVTAAGGGLRCMKNRKGNLRGVGDFFDPESVPTSPEHARQMLREWPPVGLTPALVPQLERHLSDDPLVVMASYAPSVGQAFPTFEFININGAVAPGVVAPFLALHSWVPKGMDTFEIWTWVLVEKDATPEMKVAARRAAIHNFGSSGDDGQWGFWERYFDIILGTDD